MTVRLGEILVEQGMMTASQVAEVLQQQLISGEPFGVLCERMFHIDPTSVEEAWAAQYSNLTRLIDPCTEPIDERALELVTRRQAWQFRVLPIRFDGDELMMATTRTHLRRALRFATNVIRVPVYLVMCDPDALGDALCRHYSLPGITRDCIHDDWLEQVLGTGTR